MPEPTPPSLEVAEARTEPRSIADLALKIDRRRPAAAGTAPVSPVGRLDRGVRSCPVKVPSSDWERVICGLKPMFRTYSGYWRNRHSRLFPADEQFPRPTVIYTQPDHAKRYHLLMAVVTAYRQEPLGAISPADLQREGFETVRQFKRYWKQRYWRYGWRPEDLISVVELRPWRPGDDEEQARWLLERLYGEWL